MVYKRAMVLLIVASLLMFGGLASVIAQDATSTPANELDATIAVEWMQVLYDQIEVERISAPAASRMYAYAGITLYESVWFGIPGNNTMAGRIEHMPDLSYPEEDKVYDWASTANAAMNVVLPTLFPNPTEETLAAIEAVYDKYVEERAAEIDEDVLNISLEFGATLGSEIVDWIAGDYYKETRDMVWDIPTGDNSLYVLTTEGTKPAEPYWGYIRTNGLPYAEQCHVKFNLEYSEDPDSTFYKQAQEVQEVGENLTEEQALIARFWVDTPGVTGTPAGHWVMIESQLVDQLQLPLGRAAEMYGLVGIALGDAFISAWSLKYQINLLRPETYIQEHIRRSWAPYIQSPPFPEYPSGHSVVSGAAAEVLTLMFGTVAFTDRTPIITGHDEPIERSFTSFEAAAREAAISRLYGGIHYRAAIENGVRQGQCIGQYVINNIRLRQLPQGGE